MVYPEHPHYIAPAMKYVYVNKKLPLSKRIIGIYFLKRSVGLKAMTLTTERDFWLVAISWVVGATIAIVEDITSTVYENF